MPTWFIDSPRLYTDYSYFKDHFDWPNQGDGSQPLIYHCYWQGRLSRHHELSLRSLIATQSPPYRVWVWLPPNDVIENRPFLNLFAKFPNVEFKAYVPEQEAIGTPYEQRIDLVAGRTSVPRRVALDISNYLRLLALAQYGGVYFDLDVLFLKDLRALCTQEFFSQWSNRPFGNNALMSFRSNSPNIRDLIERSIKLNTARPGFLFRFSEMAGLPEPACVFPSFLFDPVWIAHDTGIPITPYFNCFE